MCGIASYIGSDHSSAKRFCETALINLHHRGPDQNNLFSESQTWLVHTRLAILDLTMAGRQPMSSTCSNYTIVFNGEIYNHLDLRKRYLNDHKFNGHSDTETIIELFAKLGEQMFSQLIGMWALIIYDRINDRVLVSRDRYGQKPLYYRFFGKNAIAFSSEIKPLLIPGERNLPNEIMLADYLAMGNYHHLGSQTFFKNIGQILPATFAWVKAGDLTISPKKYWHLPKVAARDKAPFQEADKQNLKHLLCEAVLSQTLSDVPIGATLSGGLDSSIVTGILAAASGDSRINVFTAQTPNSKWDESRYVDAFKMKWGNRINLHNKNLSDLKLSSSLTDYIRIQEEPFGDPSIMAHGFLMDMAKNAGVKVILGGQGADEIARGYHHNIHQLFSSQVSALNFSYVIRETKKLNTSKSEDLRILLGGVFPGIERILRHRSRKRRMFFLSQFITDKLSNTSAKTLALPNDLDSGLVESIYGIHLPHLVHYDDRNAMARSIEGRMPFLDHRLLETLSIYRPEEFFKNGLSKLPLREAAAEFIPVEIYSRRDKVGFFTPIHEMIFSETDWLTSQVRDFNFFDKKQFDKDIAIYKSGSQDNDASRRIFRIVSACIWAKEFNVSIC